MSLDLNQILQAIQTSLVPSSISGVIFGTITKLVAEHFHAKHQEETEALRWRLHKTEDRLHQAESWIMKMDPAYRDAWLEILMRHQNEFEER